MHFFTLIKVGLCLGAGCKSFPAPSIKCLSISKVPTNTFRMYSPDQLSKYFTHISFREGKHEKLSLSYLTELLKRHRAKVPFENLSIHYSKTHLLSLDPSDLYTKIVDRGMGGYCMELNIFFGTVLRSLGYTLFYAGGRVSDATAGIPGAGYTGW